MSSPMRRNYPWERKLKYNGPLILTPLASHPGTDDQAYFGTQVLEGRRRHTVTSAAMKASTNLVTFVTRPSAVTLLERRHCRSLELLLLTKIKKNRYPELLRHFSALRAASLSKTNSRCEETPSDISRLGFLPWWQLFLLTKFI